MPYGNIIKITRGDSFKFDFIACCGDKQAYLQLSESEVIYFALMYPNQPFKEAILIQGYTADDQNKNNGEITIKLSPKDTEGLVPGVYYYTIKYKKGGIAEIVDGSDNPTEVKTLVERTKFIVCE